MFVSYYLGLISYLYHFDNIFLIVIYWLTAFFTHFPKPIWKNVIMNQSYHFQTCAFLKIRGENHISFKFFGHSRPISLSWPKYLHSRWLISPLIVPKSKHVLSLPLLMAWGWDLKIERFCEYYSSIHLLFLRNIHGWILSSAIGQFRAVRTLQEFLPPGEISNKVKNLAPQPKNGHNIPFSDAIGSENRSDLTKWSLVKPHLLKAPFTS